MCVWCDYYISSHSGGVGEAVNEESTTEIEENAPNQHRNRYSEQIQGNCIKSGHFNEILQTMA